ncbi:MULTISPECIES: hypothetical protein [unclassified Azospirillum]|jgi:hypothetical protein|uniref:hypothetical protein n=1 Tax=unclassified Azospirillum TaxID=2630922 RepID=UPI0011784287|nr:MULTISPECIES: hypothetical protein [unclassified Azospirillum]
MSLSYFPKNFIETVLGRIIDTTVNRAHPADVTRVFVSNKAFSLAMIEADFDATFLKSRRGFERGISEGKICGILLYRLYKHRIINLSSEIIENDHYENFQEKVIIEVVCGLLKVNTVHPWIREKIGKERVVGSNLKFQDIFGELMYILSRRHYNQESLGLFFDSISYLVYAITELEKN